MSLYDTLLENGGRCIKNQIASRLREFTLKETNVQFAAVHYGNASKALVQEIALIVRGMSIAVGKESTKGRLASKISHKLALSH